MDYAEFSASIKELAPGHKPEAVPNWREFAAECVKEGQFVHFKPMADKVAAEEKWLDVIYEGFCAVKEHFGLELAVAVIDLGCEPACLYPGEMMQAAACLEWGGNAKQIFGMIESGAIDSFDLFSPISRQELKKVTPLIVAEYKKSVVAQLKMQPQPGRKKTAPKKSAER